MIKREESRHDFAFMAGVVIGAVAGALATLALAPRAGTETRDRLRARMSEMPIEDLRARATSLRDVAATRTEQLREAASSTSASDVVKSTRSRVTEVVDRSPLPVTIGAGDSGDLDEAAEAADEALDQAAETVDDAAAAAADQADQVLEEKTGPLSDNPDEDAEDESKT